MISNKTTRKGLLALSPIVVLLGIYLIGSLVAGDFYRIPIAVAFLLASIYAILITRGTSFKDRIAHFSRGAADARIMYMIWIFVLAGAFAAIAKAGGAIDATVDLTLSAIPMQFLPAGIFIATCFISMSIGTSVGAIVALTPVVSAMAIETGYPMEWMIGIVVGGAFFGDNLSFISDTTIAATQTQGCSMRDKFRANFRMVLPVAIIVLIVYGIAASHILPDGAQFTTPSLANTHWWLVLPYLLVIIIALCGVDVLIVLLIGIIAAAFTGWIDGHLSPLQIFTEMGAGIQSMCELIIITMLAGGLLEIVRVNGGLTWLMGVLTRGVRTRRGAETSITLLTALANFCTANNTIAILTVGDMTKQIAEKYDISPKRTASLMDTTSCAVQGLIPYGAQLLMASGLAAVNPLSIIPHLYYPIGIGLAVIVTILIQPRSKKKA